MSLTRLRLLVAFFAEGILRFLKEGSIPGEGPSESTCSAAAGSLLVVTTDSINGLGDTAEEWEEIEFMVDSGAGATVVGPEDVKAVQVSDPDPARNYKLADGSLTQDKGKKSFNAQAPDESW